jgi:hypothetical protein
MKMTKHFSAYVQNSMQTQIVRNGRQEVLTGANIVENVDFV